MASTIASPLDRLVDENNKKNLAVDKRIKKMYIWCYIQVIGNAIETE
jgi:hypothetical protein